MKKLIILAVVVIIFIIFSFYVMIQCSSNFGYHKWFVLVGWNSLRGPARIPCLSNQGGVIWTINPFGFREIGHGFAKDGISVFYGEKRIKGVDQKTFIVSDGFAKDKNFVFNIYSISSHNGADYVELDSIPGADSASFSAIGDGYFKDKNYVYMHEGLGGYWNLWGMTVIPGANPASFVLGARAYSFPKSNNYSSDCLLFISWDKSALYFGPKVVEGFNPNFFELLPQPNQTNCFYRDDKAVYTKRLNDSDFPHEISLVRLNVDRDTFHFITHDQARDKNHLYEITLSDIKIIGN